MRLDHVAYRVKNRAEAVKFLESCLGYSIDPSLKEGFDIQFEDGTVANCLALVPPEAERTNGGRAAYGLFGSVFHAAPEIFVSEGSENSIVAEWVENNGPGLSLIHI